MTSGSALDAGLDLTAVAAVLLTHHHSDHVSDLATFAITRWSAGAATPLTVVTPAGPAARYAGACLSIFDDQSFHAQADPDAGARPSIRVEPFASSHRVATVLDRDGWVIGSALVDHRPIEPAVGYRIERMGRRHRGARRHGCVRRCPARGASRDCSISPASQWLRPR